MVPKSTGQPLRIEEFIESGCNIELRGGVRGYIDVDEDAIDEDVVDEDAVDEDVIDKDVTDGDVIDDDCDGEAGGMFEMLAM